MTVIDRPITPCQGPSWTWQQYEAWLVEHAAETGWFYCAAGHVYTCVTPSLDDRPGTGITRLDPRWLVMTCARKVLPGRSTHATYDQVDHYLDPKPSHKVIPDVTGAISAARMIGGPEAAAALAIQLWDRRQANAWRKALHVKSRRVIHQCGRSYAAPDEQRS